MVKLVHMETEGAHQSIRRARQRGMDAVKKAFKGASEDDRKRAEKEVMAALRARQRTCPLPCFAGSTPLQAPALPCHPHPHLPTAIPNPLPVPPPQVQKLHDSFSAEVERLKKAKDAELREHRD
jgi:hypothetical protein